MLTLEEKKALFAELTRRVNAEYETVLAAQKATQEGATHEEAKPENDKDTRALEQSYLARGQAERVISLKAEVDQLKVFSIRMYTEDAPLGLGAVVRTQDNDGREQLYVLSPGGAGEILPCRLGPTKVVTRDSPLGRALIGARQDEDVEIQAPTGKRILSLISIC